MRIVKDTLTCILETDNPKIIEVLRAKYSFPVPGYQYSPAYRARRWDGKKRYFASNGKFRTGLLARVLKDLKSIGVDTKSIVECKKTDKDNSNKVVSVKKFKYRNYQEDAILHCLKNKIAIVDSPTGSGKTLIMAGVIASLQSLDPDMYITVLFREKGILKQTYEFFQECGIKGLGINSGEGYKPGRVMLSTVQSIERIIDSHLKSSKLLMVDEAHQFCKGETTVAAIESFPNAIYRLAFTATPPREGAKDINARMVLEGAFGEVYTTRTADELIKDGSLAKPIIQIIDIPPPSSIEADLSYMDIYEKFIVNNDTRNNKIKEVVDKVYKANPNAKILILVKNLQHIENLKKLITNHYSIEGKDDIGSRYDVIKSFVSDDKPSTIIGTNVMQTGISIDEISHMINARGLEGEIPTIQGLGRGIRKAKDKDTMYFYDFYDNVKYLEKHSKSRIKHYTKLKFEVNHVKL
tara:strand:- start:308 stop:1705 length:1398 start_codon:yes stop_codon:yes gene_type:complete